MNSQHQGEAAGQPDATPKRIQRKRTRGWRMPEGTLYVGRGSRWGNPFAVVTLDDGTPGVFWKTAKGDWKGARYGGFPDVRSATEFAVSLYRHNLLAQFAQGTFDRGEHLAPLAGHDLACWCEPGEPCHADVLLELANPTDRAGGQS